MKAFISAVVVLTAVSATPVLAQNANNPAPTYPSTASATPADTAPAPIVNSNNPAPRYPVTAKAASATPVRHGVHHASMRHTTRHASHNPGVHG